jgi:hypothetical protein
MKTIIALMLAAFTMTSFAQPAKQPEPKKAEAKKEVKKPVVKPPEANKVKKAPAAVQKKAEEKNAAKK